MRVESRIEGADHVSAEPLVVGLEHVEHPGDSDPCSSLVCKVGCCEPSAVEVVFGDEIGFEVRESVLDGDNGCVGGGSCELFEVQICLFRPDDGAGESAVGGESDSPFDRVLSGVDMDEVEALFLESLVES